MKHRYTIEVTQQLQGEIRKSNVTCDGYSFTDGTEFEFYEYDDRDNYSTYGFARRSIGLISNVVAYHIIEDDSERWEEVERLNGLRIQGILDKKKAIEEAEEKEREDARLARLQAHYDSALEKLSKIKSILSS